MQSQTLWTWEMKRFRTIFLLILYILVLVFTIVMEYISIMNQSLRLLVNGSTFLMAVVSGVLFWAILHDGTKEKDRQGELGKEPKDSAGSRGESFAEDNETNGTKKLVESEFVFNKQKYLEFASRYELTRREAEIGILLLNDYTNLRISEELFIAETTVKKHLTHIYEKTQTDGRKSFKVAVKQALEENEKAGTIKEDL